MKTARFLLMFVAAATMMLASCEKEPSEAKPNTLVLNGKVYQLNCRYSVGVDDRSYVDATTVDKDANGEPLYTVFAYVEINTLNHTYDLTNLVESDIIYWTIHDADWSVKIGPVLPSGTVSISRDDKNFVYKVNGTREDGSQVSLNVTVPAENWEHLEFCGQRPSSF